MKTFRLFLYLCLLMTLGKASALEKPNIIIFYVDDLAGKMSGSMTSMISVPMRRPIWTSSLPWA